MRSTRGCVRVTREHTELELSCVVCYNQRSEHLSLKVVVEEVIAFHRLRDILELYEPTHFKFKGRVVLQYTVREGEGRREGGRIILHPSLSSL